MDNSRQIWVFLVVEDDFGNLGVFWVILGILGYFLAISGDFGFQSPSVTWHTEKLDDGDPNNNIL